MIFNRRHFMKAATALGGGVSAMLGAGSAHAASVDGYKALVGVNFVGGLDSHEMIMPYDQPSWDEFAKIRPGVLANHASFGNSVRDRSALLKLSTTPGDFDGREYAMGPEISGLHNLFETGRAAVIGNVGAMIDRFDRFSFDLELTRMPPRLHSHNDQRSFWASLQTEGARFGWGGAFMDAMLDAGANRIPEFSSMTVHGVKDAWQSGRTGQNTQGYQLTGGQAPRVRELDEMSLRLSRGDVPELRRLFDSHLRGDGVFYRNVLERDYANASRRAIDVNKRFNDVLSQSETLPLPMPNTSFGIQLQRVALAIANSDALEANRQLYYVARGGFDTHNHQGRDAGRLLAQFSDAVSAFQDNMDALGMADQVTLFTMGEFGRTLNDNGDGTDHGWGAHHMVVGGAVNGGKVYGNLPPTTLEHRWDAGRGVLIPQISIEQYAAGLGRWFGLSDQELNMIFPRLLAHGGHIERFV